MTKTRRSVSNAPLLLLTFQLLTFQSNAFIPTTYKQNKPSFETCSSCLPMSSDDEEMSTTTTTPINNPSPNSRREFLTIVAGAATTATILSKPSQAQASETESNINPSTTTTTNTTTIDYQSIFQKASQRALGGGTAGASAAVIQVCTLMWLRTIMNYQYRYGGTLTSSLQTLYNEGGIPRLYQGLPFALVQGPLTKFGDTAANVGILALLSTIPQTATLPIAIQTACGSITAGLWRIVCMPIDTSKTVMQVEGQDGLTRLRETVLQNGPAPLYQGSVASAAATAVGHFPWFLTYNFMNDALPVIRKEEDLFLFLVRAAVLGLVASCVSDTCSNSLRVIKTTKQTGRLSDEVVRGVEKEKEEMEEEKKKQLSYREALTLVLEKDGVKGLFGRGLKTRLLANAIQGAAFSVLWKYFQTINVQ